MADLERQVTWAQPKQRAQQERKRAEPKQERVTLTRESGVGSRRVCVNAAAATCRRAPRSLQDAASTERTIAKARQ